MTCWRLVARLSQSSAELGAAVTARSGDGRLLTSSASIDDIAPAGVVAGSREACSPVGGSSSSAQRSPATSPAWSRVTLVDTTTGVGSRLGDRGKVEQLPILVAFGLDTVPALGQLLILDPDLFLGDPQLLKRRRQLLEGGREQGLTLDRLAGMLGEPVATGPYRLQLPGEDLVVQLRHGRVTPCPPLSNAP